MMDLTCHCFLGHEIVELGREEIDIPECHLCLETSVTYVMKQDPVGVFPLKLMSRRK